MKKSEKIKLILERNTVYQKMPEGWGFIEGALTAPVGYAWISNKKSRFSPDFEQGLLKIYSV